MSWPKASIPDNESERLRAMLEYNLLDTPAEADFDSLAELVSFICQTPIAIISLMDSDRQWYKAKVGMENSEVPRNQTFCQYALHYTDVMEVPDSTKDERFKEYVMVKDDPYIRFYAGIPLTSPDGYNIGTMCVVDKEPRQLSDEQKKALRTIANQVMAQMELRKRNNNLKGELDRLLQKELDKTKQQLQSTELELDSLYKAIDKANLTIEFDPHGLIVDVNENYLHLLEYTKEELIGKHHSILMEEQEKASIAHRWEKLQSGNFISGRFKRIAKSGTEVWLQITFCPITDSLGNFSGVFVIGQNISNETRAEQQMELAKELAERALFAKDSFLTNMSHEIRTPMNAIIGFNELLKLTSLDQDQKEYVEAMSTAGENLLVLINDILDLSKIESGQLELEKVPFNPINIIHNTQQLLQVKALEKQLTLQVQIHPSVPQGLLGDDHRLTQILVNLIGNAIKFTEKGRVQIEVEAEAISSSSSLLIIRVADTGIGIASEKLHLIFDRFTQSDKNITRKYGGTGLGLNITKRLVEMQEGSIEVKSTIGEGTVFTVSIPYENADLGEIAALEKEYISGNSGESLRILLCEDNKLNQRLAQIIFERLGHQLTTVDNGELGIQELKKHDFDLVLMDIQMPEMDGYQVTRTIREELKSEVPIIAMTAHSMKGEEEKCLAHGMNDYISKPFSLDDLVSKLAQHTHRNGGIQTERIASKEITELVDLSYLSELSDGNLDFRNEMIRSFLIQMPQEIRNLKQAFANQNAAGMKSVAHKVKSSIYIMGITQLLPIFDEIEQDSFSFVKDEGAIGKLLKLDQDLQSIYEYFNHLLVNQE